MRVKRAAYGFVVLAVLMLLVGSGNLLWSAHLADQASRQAVQQDQETRQVLCTLIGPVVAVPVPKPPDPKANPSRETTYEWYERYLSVSKSFRCN